MKCPYCGNLEDKVIDSRTSKEGSAIRRRRECQKCLGRFTSYENIEDIQLKVIKKDGRREIFDRNKIRTGINKACEKRAISAETIEDIIDKIENTLHSKMQKEVHSKEIGEILMKILSQVDDVAYVRFASVYKEFKDINEFMNELKKLLLSQTPTGIKKIANTKKSANKKK